MATQNNAAYSIPGFLLGSVVSFFSTTTNNTNNNHKHSNLALAKKQSLDWHDLDEKQVLDRILNNYLREASITTYFPNELRGLIHRFFIHEWAIHGVNKNTGTVYDAHGFDISGIHKETKNRLDPRGFKQNGDYKDVHPTTGKPTKYNPQGYNIDRWHKNGLHENGRSVDHNGFTQDVSHASIALHKASKSGDIQAVNLLLTHPSVNVNVKANGYTPLIRCCKKGDQWLEIAKVLLAHPNIDVNLKDGNWPHNPPLIWCCKKEALQIAKALLAHPNIDVNLKDDSMGNTPLIRCFDRGNASLQIAKLLLGHKNINVNLKDKDGYTSLDKIMQNVNIYLSLIHI